MKVNFSRPTLNELTKTYNLYQLNKVDLHLFLNTYQWCRYDSRLGEILVHALRNHWFDWNPMEIRKRIKYHPWPQVLGVLGDHTSLLIPAPDRRYFDSWLQCCLYQVSWQAEWSLFHIDLFKFGGKLLRSEAIDAIPLYLKWGFYAKTPLVDFQLQPQANRRTFIEKSRRYDKLKELFAIKKQIQVKDYIEFLDSKISKRTAELDLHQWARKRGQTKGAVYIQK